MGTALHASAAALSFGDAAVVGEDRVLSEAVATNYWFLIHGSVSARRTIAAAVDGAAYANSTQQVRNYPTWTMIAPGKSFGDYMCVYPLAPGRHTIRIKTDCDVFPCDGLVLTTNPTAFEPR